MSDNRMYPADVLENLMATYAWTIDRVAQITGLSPTQIDGCKKGHRTLSILAWRDLYRETRDIRILQLLIPNAIPASSPAVSSTGATSAGPIHGDDPRTLIPKAISAMDQCLACLRYVHRIVANGRVDQSDDIAINGFFQHSRDAVRLIEETAAAIAAFRAAAASERRPG